MAQYDIEAIRKKIQSSLSNKHADPDEFRPPKAKNATEKIVFRFFILPPYQAGEVIGGGKVKAKKGLDSQFFVSHASHWVDNKPYPCPRVAGTDECPICQFGFDLLKDEKIKANNEKRLAVIKQWMPNQVYCMNIYFLHDKNNPEDLRGKTMFYNAPKTVVDACMRTLMADDPGDSENPQAFGLFFDETNAYPFELQILKQGSQNSYKTSLFLPKAKPMIRKEDGSPDLDALADLLKSRHDLHSKIEAPDMERIKKVFAAMKDGDDPPADGRAPGGFDSDEGAPAKKETVKTTTSRQVAAKPAVVPDDDEVPAKTVTKAATAKATPAAAPATKAAPVEPLEAEAPLSEAEVPGLASMLSQLDDD